MSQPDGVGKRRGLLVVLSGPSGVGKDAAIAHLKKQGLEIYHVVTATTRAAGPTRATASTISSNRRLSSRA